MSAALRRLLVFSQVALLVATLAATPPPTLASTVSGAAFTGGTGTVSVGGTLYAKNGGALTLTVNASSDTKCVDVSGAFTGHQTSSTAKSTWTFSFTAGAGDGTQTATAAASPNFNQINCTGQSQSPQSASFVLDNTGPVVTAALSPAPNGAGWNNSNISITWSASDAGSGVASGPTPATDSQSGNTTGVTKTASATDRLGNVGNGSVTVKLDKTAPTISGSRNPAANANGWNNTDVTVSFTCSDSPAGIKSCSGPTTLSSSAANQSVAGTAVDNADNRASATVSGINIDKVAPTLTGAPTTSPNANGWYSGTVAIHWTASDALSGLAGSSPADSTISSEGTGLTASASVSDKAGNSTNATSSPAVNIDKTAPNTTATAPANWNNSNVTVSLNATDALSGVGSTFYTLDGGAQQSGTSIAISSEGVHTLQFWSTDKAGNIEATKSVQVKIDKTPPTINHTQSPAANANGWNNTDVTVTFVCGDALSGVASCTPAQTVTTEGQSQAVTGTATDNAGNSATDPATVSIDKTAPTISAAAGRSPNANGWYNADVTIGFTCGDTLSGIDICPAAKTLGEGAGQSASGTAADAAGNIASSGLSGIDVDKTAPSLSGAATTSPNGSGWYRGDVTIHWTASDALSGLDGTAPADLTITGEGPSLSASASVNDLAGNSTSTTVDGIKVDRTPPSTTATVPDPLASGWYAGQVPVQLTALDPLSGVAATYFAVDGGSPQLYVGPFDFDQPGSHTIAYWSVDNAGNVEDASVGHVLTIKNDNVAPTISGSRLPLGNVNGWNNEPVVVSFTCADAESGIKACTNPVTLSSEGAGQSVTGTATDFAGNSDSATVGGINIDLTPPATTATAPGGWTKTDVTVSLGASDNLSGVASTSYVLDGGAEQSGTSVAIGAEGVHTLQYWSTDNAGNAETAKTVQVEIDKSAPTIAHTQDPVPNADGWNNSDVTVTFTCDDQVGLSGIASCTSPQTVSTEGTGQPVTGTALDNAGNTRTDTASVNLDKTPPTVAGAPDRAANAKGWYNAPVTFTFTCGDDRSGIKLCPWPQTISGDGAGQTAQGSAADNADNTASTTVSGINIDTTAPELSGSPTAGPNANGWYNADVTIHWSASDALSGLDGPAPADSTISSEGENLTASASVSDNAGNTTNANSSPAVNIDKTPPLTTATAPGGWTNADVTVSLDASDNLSGIASTFYALDGGTQQSGKSVAIASEGTHTLTFWSVDQAGNAETPKTVQVKIDKTAPTITHTQDPVPNGAGWNNSDVTVTFTCADQPELSGIANCTAPRTISSEGKGEQVTGTAFDNAGNSAIDTAIINLDKTPPTVSGAPDRAPNATGWYNADVTVTFTCGDGLSGVAFCSSPWLLRGEGAAQSATGGATDKAANSSSTTVSGINIDMTPPSLSGSPTTSPNANGWYHGDVTIHWAASDALSGLAGSAPADSVITGEGSGLTASASVSDKAGNATDATSSPSVNIDRTAPVTTATAPGGWAKTDVTVELGVSDNLSGVAATYFTLDGGSEQQGNSIAITAEGTHTLQFWSTDKAGNIEATKSVQVKIDKTPPTISGAATTSPNAVGWYKSNVTVHFTCADQPTLSGVASCPTDVTLTTDGSNQSVSGTATDNAGNSASVTVSGLNIDTAAPSVSTTGVTVGGVYTLGAVPTPGCAATDGGSGLAGSCTYSQTGGLPNGVGTFSFTVSATDKAGNTATATGSYRVIYRWDGFLQPINDTAHQIGSSTSVFKGGSTVPAKFQLKAADGTVVQANTLPLWVSPAKGVSTTAAVDETVYSDTATSGSTYRWDSSSLQYIYNWSTKGLTTGFFYRVGVTLDDGQTYYVNLGLK